MPSDRKSLHCTIVGQFFWVKIIPAIIKYTCYLTENVHLCRITKWRTRALALLTIDMSEILRGAKISPLFFGSFNLDFWLWCANGKLLRNLVNFDAQLACQSNRQRITLSKIRQKFPCSFIFLIRWYGVCRFRFFKTSSFCCCTKLLLLNCTRPLMYFSS